MTTKVKGNVALLLEMGVKTIQKEFNSFKGAEKWISKMSKNDKFLHGECPTLALLSPVKITYIPRVSEQEWENSFV